MLCLSHTQDANPVGTPFYLGEIKPVFATVASRASPARSSLDGVILAHRISPARGPKYLRHAEVGCTGPIFVDRQAPGPVAPPFSLPRLDHEGRRRPPEPTTRLPSAADRHVSCPPQGPFSTPCSPPVKAGTCQFDDLRGGRPTHPHRHFVWEAPRTLRQIHLSVWPTSAATIQPVAQNEKSQRGDTGGNLYADTGIGQLPERTHEQRRPFEQQRIRPRLVASSW